MSYAPIPMVPGPVALHEDVIAVLGRDYGSGQVESDFLCLYDAASRGIGKLMGTKDDVVLMTGEGMLALWGALKSCLKPGDHVVSAGTGVFGDGIGEMAESSAASWKRCPSLMTAASVKATSPPWRKPSAASSRSC